jgi:hypothetical protein
LELLRRLNALTVETVNFWNFLKYSLFSPLTSVLPFERIKKCQKYGNLVNYLVYSQESHVRTALDTWGQDSKSRSASIGLPDRIAGEDRRDRAPGIGQPGQPSRYRTVETGQPGQENMDSKGKPGQGIRDWTAVKGQIG